MHRVWVALWIVPMLFQKYLSIIFHKFCSATAVCQYEQHVSVWIRNALSDQKSPALALILVLELELACVKCGIFNIITYYPSSVFVKGTFVKKCSEQMCCITKVFMRSLENGIQRVITENQWLWSVQHTHQIPYIFRIPCILVASFRVFKSRSLGVWAARFHPIIV